MKENLKVKTKQKRFQMNKKAFIFMAVMCMGIGFAFLSSNLTITGNTSVSGNKWNVYFTNVQETDGSVDATVVPTVTGTTTTSLTYTVNLDKPGDFYEFTVDAVNNGTIDAMIDSINMTSLETDVTKYLSYTATYEYGKEIAQKDVLQKNSTETYKVRVEYKKNIEASDLSEEGVNLTLTFGVNYVQSTVVNEFAKLVSRSALSDTSLDFTQISSESNGRGLYVMNSTKNNSYPIYYYRGNVSNNNAKFAGFCWKIVRTTDTGGTKLIYNGRPNETTGECDATGDATQLASTSKFNENWNSPAYNGYMYGTVYAATNGAVDANDIYGSSFTYENGAYTLSDTHNGVDSTHHYTCLSSSTSCESVNYVYYVDGSTAYYITLTGGKSVEDALAEMQTNTNNSTVKTTIDNWFNNTFKTYFTTNSKDYNDYLEDTVWCNDRSMNTIEVYSNSVNNGWKPNGGDTGYALFYGTYGRTIAGTPSLSCSNKNDAFTVNETSAGNGALDYPVGLLTMDEVMLAGGKFNANNTDYYLYTNNVWLSMSPSHFNNMNYANEFYVVSDGWLFYNSVSGVFGVRPSISLKPEVKVADGGDGTSTSPYEFVVE